MTTTADIERRELAHRINDGIDVTLFWTETTNRVTIAVLDSHTEESLEFDVNGRDALDAFNHPYAYAATRRSLVPATAQIASDGLAVGTEE